MKARDEYFIPDPDNGDISGSESGALSCCSPLLRCALPVRRELLVARLASPPTFLRLESDPIPVSVSLL
ncbi:hypothetical protein VZT92_012667 [Zoarces viviparus]|uniref:Uncharacterized protein n=1 Tax=Zoarces viviparus TaxID=48416 RepID=A0AAW1F2I4_ZOAVI